MNATVSEFAHSEVYDERIILGDEQPAAHNELVSDGTLEGLKWFALLLMTGDHVNKYLFKATLPFLFEAGRLALPLFVFVLACNLARPGALERGLYARAMARLALFGSLATVPYMALGGLSGGWWPLNVLFTLLTITAVMYLIELRTTASYVAAAFVFVFGGSSVEYWWPALTFGLAVWWYCKRPTWIAPALATAALAALAAINGNQWALAALPLLLLATRLDLYVPRVRWVFYAYYPIHLAAIWLLRIPMPQSGYVLS